MLCLVGCSGLLVSPVSVCAFVVSVCVSVFVCASVVRLHPGVVLCPSEHMVLICFRVSALRVTLCNAC